MALLLKKNCEKCNKDLVANGLAFICSYECTYCEECYLALKTICPNCGGELVRRPKREPKKNPN